MQNLQLSPMRHILTSPDRSSLERATPKIASSQNSSLWLVNPVIDLLFVCGGLVWILLACHLTFIGSNSQSLFAQALALLVLAGTHTLSETHTAATLARVYRSAENRRRFSLYTEWAALGLGALALTGLFVPVVIQYMAKIYLLFVIQHFTAQTYGLTLLYCYKHKYSLRPWEKRLLWSVMNGTAVFAMLRQLTYKEWNPDGFLGLKIPFWGPLPEWIIQSWQVLLSVGFAALIGVVIYKLVSERVVMPLPALLLVATGTGIFLFGRETSGLLFLYAPAFFHGSQYMAISVSAHLKEQKFKDDSPQNGAFNWSNAMKYQGFLLLCGLAIYIALPHLLQEVGFSYTLAFAAIFTAVNLHHFLVDQAIWKLRDPKLRQSLLS